MTNTAFIAFTMPLDDLDSQDPVSGYPAITSPYQDEITRFRKSSLIQTQVITTYTDAFQQAWNSSDLDQIEKLYITTDNILLPAGYISESTKKQIYQNYEATLNTHRPVHSARWNLQVEQLNNALNNNNVDLLFTSLVQMNKMNDMVTHLGVNPSEYFGIDSNNLGTILTRIESSTRESPHKSSFDYQIGTLRRSLGLNSPALPSSTP